MTNEGLRIHWKSLYDYMGDGSVVSYWIRIAQLTGDDTYLSYAKNKGIKITTLPEFEV